MTRRTRSHCLLARRERAGGRGIQCSALSGPKRVHAQSASFRGTMATGVIRQGNHRLENLFFSGMAVLILGTVFLGSARSYYLAGVFKAPLPNLIVHIHGAVFSSWILLLIAQTSLVAAGRTDLHRRLGLLGFALACVVVHGKDSSRHALGQRVPDRPATGAQSHRANRPLAEFRHVGAESRPFFPLSAKATGAPCYQSIDGSGGTRPFDSSK